MQSLRTDTRNMRLLVCIALWFRPKRLRYFFEQVRSLSEMYVGHIDLVVMTQTTDEKEIAQIMSLVRPMTLSGRLKVKVLSYPDDSSKRKYYLTWEHKAVIRDVFLDKSLDYSYFVYLEDDMRFTYSNLVYFIDYLPALRSARLLPGFARVEYNLHKQQLFFTDITVSHSLEDCATVDVAGVRFVSTFCPYCGVLVIDKSLGLEHLQSKTFDVDASEALYTGFNTPERANIGLMFDQYPAELGFRSRYVLPLSIDSCIPLQECMIEHLPGNFTNNVNLEFGHGSVAIDAGFFGRFAKPTLSVDIV